MSDFATGTDAYLWIKALHIIAIICWMAGLLYLPRLFVYHTQTHPGSEGALRFQIMEKRLLHYITTPAMLVSWLSGLWLAISVYHMSGTWLYLKLFLVLLLSGYHGFLAKHTRLFAQDAYRFSEKTWRFLNELPTLLMVLIVLLVVLKPFA